jgi:hypothetical protein
MASALANGLRATPAVDPRVQQTFDELIRGLQGSAITEAEAERRVAAWLASAPPHAATVLRSVILTAASQKRFPPDSWLYRVFVSKPSSPPRGKGPARPR